MVAAAVNQTTAGPKLFASPTVSPYTTPTATPTAAWRTFICIPRAESSGELGHEHDPTLPVMNPAQSPIKSPSVNPFPTTTLAPALTSTPARRTKELLAAQSPAPTPDATPAASATGG